MSKNDKSASEWQFDGLVGPTHNYAGLAFGNVAAALNAGEPSNPRKAALEGLAKMKFVRDLGVKQALFPPHLRPVISVMKRIGFDGSTAKILDDAYRQAPQLLAAVYSSAFMWAANAATVSPSADASDAKVHLTPANLISNFHRSLESGFTTKLLRRIFKDSSHFMIHDPLPAALQFSDEGAANTMRVCASHGEKGLNIFVYGTGGSESLFNAPQRSLPSGAETLSPKRYPARQQRAAFEAIARSHGLAPEACMFVQQSPAVIDQGVFHNDVIAMNTTRLLIAHEHAFSPNDAVKKSVNNFNKSFNYIEISEEQLSVDEAVKSYFFNSQLLDLGDGKFTIVAPSECEENPRARHVLESLTTNNQQLTTHYRDVRESMRNGGGPACLRLRVVLTREEGERIHQGVVLTDDRLAALEGWVARNYRDRLVPQDLRDPLFIGELEDAASALSELLGMPDLYDL